MSSGNDQGKAGRRIDPLRIRVGFELGLFSRDDVSDWVTSEIEGYDVIPDPLLELAVLTGKHDVEVAILLRASTPEATPEALARVELGARWELVRSGRWSRERAAQAIVQIAEDVSADDYRAAIEVEYALDLAIAGVFGTRREADDRLDAFLRRFAFLD